MNKKKFLIAILVSVLCILMNIGGKTLTTALRLPMMFDTIGTMLCAYIYGPIHGAIVGLASNVAYCAPTPIYSVYALVNIATGIIIGISAKRKHLENMFGILSASMIVTIYSVIISTPLNIIFFDGAVNNKWANGVVGLLKMLGANEYFAYFAGEFFLDFVDKLCTILVLVTGIRIYRKRASRRVRKIVKLLLNISMSLVLCVALLSALPVTAAQVDLPVQTDQSVTVPDVPTNSTDPANSIAPDVPADTDVPVEPDAPVNPANPNSTEYHPTIPVGQSSGVTVDKKLGTFLRIVYNSENGLPGGMVNDIAETKDGILWIGTYGGLYRYNGNNFRLMNEFDSVKAVNCFFTDEEGRLWIGTNDSGLSICINNEISNIINVESGLPSDSVRSIAQGNNGNYYVGTADALAVVTLSNGLTVTKVINEITYAKSISTSGEYAAVVSDSGELYLLKGTSIIDKSSEKSMYSCCRFSESGKLYAGRGDGNIDIFDVTTGTLIKTGEQDCGELDSINSMTPGLIDGVIICADNGAGYINESGEFYEINLGKFSSCIDHTIADYQGNLWFTSSRLGLLKMCHSPFNEIYTALELDPEVVNAVTEWNGVLYFGTDSGIDAADAALTHVVNNKVTEACAEYRVRCLMTDKGGNLWICTARDGALCVDKDMNITNYNVENGAISSRSRSTLETSNGDILIASDMGITCVRDGKVEYTLGEDDGFDTPKILCLYETQTGDILAGTDGSGIAVIRNEEIVDVLNKSDGLSSNIILKIVPDSDGTGYFIVAGNSLSYMDNNYNIRTLTNFPYFNNFDVVENRDGMLFVLSSAGIYAMDKNILLSGGSEYILLDYSRGLRTRLIFHL